MKKYLFCILLVILFSGIYPQKANAAASINIIIDPGHGGDLDETSWGACYNNLREKDVNLATAMALKKELEAYGNVNVFLTRTTDEGVTISQRVDRAQLVNADLIVSVHHNAKSHHLFYGGEIFVPSAGRNNAVGTGVAKQIIKQWSAAGVVSRGVKTRIGSNGDYYGLIRIGAGKNIPTIILEHGYLDNPKDVTRLDEPADWEKNGKMDAAGIAEYFGLKKGVEQTQVWNNSSIKVPAGVVGDDRTAPTDVKLEINSYNPATGEVKYTVSAKEPESRCMYYGFAITCKLDQAGNVVPDIKSLEVWNGKNQVKGTTYVPAGYSGPVCVAVYNNYDLVGEYGMAVLK